jgi:hypothetical protein
MKRITNLLACVCISAAGYAQTFLPASIPDMAMPVAASGDVYLPIKTSAYSYENVIFDMSGFGVGPYLPMDLSVYSWNGGNYVNSGIAWTRRAPGGGPILDTGYITVPTSKQYMSVGIVQDPSQDVYVIVSYVQGNSMYYDMYEWTITGIPTAPLYGPVLIKAGVPGTQLWWGFNRIKMDTWNLNKIAFAWDEPVTIDEDSVVVGPGGIYVKTIEATTLAPFTFSTGNALRVSGTETWGLKPDVAIGANGNRVRIAYYNSDTAYSDLGMMQPVYIQNRDFATLMTALPPAIPFAWDDSVSNATALTNLAINDHINLDCPDYYEEDIWSVIYNMNTNVIMARTKPTGAALPVSTLLSSLLGGSNGYPAISYSQDSDEINYGWFCTTNSNYIATRLQNDGTTFVTPLAAGIYNNIALYPGMTTVSPGARLSFSRRNRDNRLFMAYPLPGFSGGGGNLDMRSKFVPWASPAFRPTNIADVDKNTGISIQPNPFTNVVTLEIVDYNNELLCVSVTDIQGRIVATIEGQLESVNRQMEDVSVRLTAGIYIVNIHSDTYHQAMKIVKQ